MDTGPRSLGWRRPLAIAVLVASVVLVVLQLRWDNGIGALGPALTAIAMVIGLVSDARRRRQAPGQSLTRGDGPPPSLRSDR